MGERGSTAESGFGVEYRITVEGDTLVEFGDGDMAYATDGGDGDGEAMDGVLSHDKIRQMIGDANPPEATRRALHHRVARLASYRVLPRMDPRGGPGVEDVGLDDRVVELLRRNGIGKLYAYQHATMEAILGGKSVVIEAPTAFGKTEAFLVPIAQLASAMPRGATRALFVYPTKALGRDQLPKISFVAESLGMRAAIFDGTTVRDVRNSFVRSPPEFLVTNFDLIHNQMFRRSHLAGMLETVKFLVVDEAHYYSGIFGANVHHIIARLKRITGPIQCAAASATLNNSGEFCSTLFGQDVRVIREGGRRATVDLAMMAPPGRIPKHRLMVNLAKILTTPEGKVMVFSNTHRNTEIVGREAMLDGLGAGIHRGGLGDEHLGRVEADFRAGALDIVSCTPTLELGIDIGDVDGVVSEIVPANRFMQRIGRAGREGARGCAFLVLGRDPISQYYLERPDEFMADEWVPHVDPTNTKVVDMHTIAAALDRPLEGDEIAERTESIQRCRAEGWLERADLTWRATRWRKFRLSKYSIRGIVEPVTIHLDGKKIGERELPMALSELHEGAVYMMAGRPYRVERLDYPQKKMAHVKALPTRARERTRAFRDKWATDAGMIRSRLCLGAGLDLCRLRITETVSTYLDMRAGKHKKLDKQLRYRFETKGVKFRPPVPSTTVAREKSKNTFLDSCHAIEHLAVSASRMITGAATDVAGTRDEDGWVYVYDNAEGGNGIAAILYERMEGVLQRAYGMVSACPCEKTGGCPHCILSYQCSNASLHKVGAMESLQKLISNIAA